MNISCGAKANPLTNSDMNWTKTHGSASTFTETKVTIHSNSSITYLRNDLEIAIVTKDDYGKYQCMAFNGLGVARDDVWVYIRCKLYINLMTWLHDYNKEWLAKPYRDFCESTEYSYSC